MTRLLLAAAVACVLVLGAAAAAGAADGTPPQISFQLVGTEGVAGWYVTPTTVRWQVGDPESGIKSSSGCDATVVGETTGTKLTCSATNFADTTTSVSVVVRVDTTPPAVTGATPDRPPDVNGWYTHAAQFAFAGTDATSGVASCAVVTYAGPDSGSASVSGTCTDRAGNVSAPGTAGLQYDATPPALRGVAARAGDGQVTVTWSPLPGSDWVDVARAVDGTKAAPRTIYHGDASSVVDRQAENGVRYRYAVIAHDPAGHVVEVAVPAMPLGAMRTPPPGATHRCGTDAQLESHAGRRALQRPALPRVAEDPQRLAAHRGAETRLTLDVPRTVAPAHPGRVPLVRVAGVPARQGLPLRQARWAEHVRAHALRMRQSSAASMFPPDTMHATLLPPVRPASAAASASAPAPSAITRTRPARTRTASSTSSSVTTAASSTTSCR